MLSVSIVLGYFILFPQFLEPFLVCELRGRNHDSNKKQIKCKAGAMIATRSGMYKSSFPHYTIDVRRSLQRSAVDARAQGLHLTASPVPHPKDKDTNHRYAKHWRSFIAEMDQLGRAWPAAVTGCGQGALLFCCASFTAFTAQAFSVFLGSLC